MHLPKLEITLYANAGFSLLSGLALLVFADQISTHLIALPAVVFLVVGFGLLVFAADVLYVARKLPVSINKARAILWADILWVVATPIAIAFSGDYISTTGVWLLIDIAGVIAVLALLEWTGIRLSDPITP